MKISVITFHVEWSREKELKNIVADYFKHYYPDAEHKGTLTLVNHRLVCATYDMDWLWSEISSFVENVLRVAKDRNILVVCESVQF